MMPKISLIVLLLGISLTACSNTGDRTENNLVNHKQKNVALEEKNFKEKENQINRNIPGKEDHVKNKYAALKNQTSTYSKSEVMKIVAKPDDIPVLINKQNKLPNSYSPIDLIYTNIPFLVSGRTERTKMRKEAAAAAEKLFAEARAQGIHLMGVSAYRSHSDQVSLFNYYAKRDGYEIARTYSAFPGTSEHETGLAIDVTGGNGQCPAQDCFGSTKEAKWLQDHAADNGFIIRYPKGKESITGYHFEPWHLRYVGNDIAKDIMDNGITLEEYYGIAPVNH